VEQESKIGLSLGCL